MQALYKKEGATDRQGVQLQHCNDRLKNDLTAEPVYFMGFTVELLAAVLQHELDFYEDGNQNIMEWTGLNEGFIEYLFEKMKPKYKPDQTDRRFIEALIAYAKNESINFA